MKKLTVIIPALNEGHEPVETVKSIRETSENIDIIVFDDGSESKLKFSKELDVQLVRNNIRKGIHYCRNVGVVLAQTPYVALFNSRMRFKPGWAEEMILHLERESQTIFCTTSVALDEKGGFTDVKRYGADVYKKNGILEPKWRNEQPGDVYEIPCVLGANYFMSKKWYQYIHGFKGLENYGCDEVFLSLKSWMLGGKCKIVKSVEIGNKYREKKPYEDMPDSLLWNKVYINFILFPVQTAESMFHLNSNQQAYEIVKNRLVHEMQEITDERRFIEKTQVRDINHLIFK